jgi:UDP:flavonoid glycosyltransferase YjiC (YdhE family)
MEQAIAVVEQSGGFVTVEEDTRAGVPVLTLPGFAPRR